MLTPEEVYDWYFVIDKYLEVMPFTSRERSEVKLSLTNKIDYVLNRNDENVTEIMRKRIEELNKTVRGAVSPQELASIINK